MAEDELFTSSDEEGEDRPKPESPFVLKYRRAVEIAEDISCTPERMHKAKTLRGMAKARWEYEKAELVRPIEEQWETQVMSRYRRMQDLLAERREAQRIKEEEKAAALKQKRAVLEIQQLREMPDVGFYINDKYTDSLVLHAAASTIAAGMRGMWGRRLAEQTRIMRDQEQLVHSVMFVQRCVRRIRYLTKTRPQRMATKLQANWRGHVTRRWFYEWRAEKILKRQNEAASSIQTSYRGLVRRRAFAFLTFGARQEAINRQLITKRATRKRDLGGVPPRWKKDDDAATRIQRLMRSRANKRAMGKAVRRQVRREALTAKRVAAQEREEVERHQTSQGAAATLLHASEFGWLHMCRKLLEELASNDPDAVPELLNEPDFAGRTPLYLACAHGHDKVVEELLEEWHADISMLDAAGRTPLHACALGSHLKCARRVVKAGVNRKAVAADGETALHMAAGAGCFPMVQMLLEVEPWLLMRTDKAGNTAYDLSLVYEQTVPGQSSSLCSFLKHCMDYPAQWRKLEWVDPNPDPEDVLDMEEGAIGETGWALYFTTELQPYYYHAESGETVWEQPDELEQHFQYLEKEQKLDRVWNRVDLDGSGGLDRDELRTVLLMLGHKPDDIDMDATMKAIDLDGSDEVDRKEFGEWFFSQGSAAQKKLASADLNPEAAKALSKEPWKCSICTTMNRRSAESCQLCGRTRRDEESQPEPEPEKAPEPVARLTKGTVLEILVVEAKELKSMDWLGKNDPYVKIKVGDAELQTSVLEGAGAQAVWGFGDGELLSFPTLEKPNVLEATVWDSDDGNNADDLIGTAWVMFDDKEPMEPWRMDVWFPVRDAKKGETTGRLHIEIMWKPILAVHDADLLTEMLKERAPGVLEIQKAHKLKAMWQQIDVDNSNALDANEVRQVMLLMGHKEGDFDIDRVMRRIDKDGSGEVDFQEFEAWYNKQAEEAQEKLAAGLEAEPEPEAAPVPKLVHGILKCTVIEATDLKSMDRFGKNDPYVIIKAPMWNASREVWSEALSRQTTVIQGGGSAPKWGRGQNGETYVFEEALKIPRRVQFSCYDSDKNEDEHIGTGFLNLGDTEELAVWTVNSWIDLMVEGKREVAGKLHVQIEWDPEIQLPPALMKGVMDVRCLQVRGLPNVDTFGKNDVYALVRVAGSDLQTAVIYSAGSTGQWRNGDGDLHFEIAGYRPYFPPSKLEVIVFDENTGEEDQLIGRHTLTLPEEKDMSPGGKFELAGWLGLECPKDGEPAGEIEIDVAWAADPNNSIQLPDRTALENGALMLRVIECSNLKQMDRIGLNDVYVRVNVVGKQRRTSTIEGKAYKERGNPWWNSGAGEAMKWRLKSLMLPTKVELTVWDEDKGSADDLIGSGMLYISPKLGTDLDRSPDFSHDQWCDIWSESGERTGRIRCAISWQPIAINTEDRTNESISTAIDNECARLTCSIHSARKLKRMDGPLKQNDVYIVVSAKSVARRTRTIYSGQHSGNPTWPDAKPFRWEYASDEDMPTELVVEAWDEDPKTDDLIGTAILRLSSRPSSAARPSNGGQTSDAPWKMERWLEVKDKKGKYAGEVQLALSWTTRPKSAATLRAEAERKLFAAVMKDDPDAVTVLIKDGVDPNARNAMGQTPLELARARGKQRAEQVLRPFSTSHARRSLESEQNVKQS